MKHLRLGRRQLIVAAMTVASAARAGVWTANPVLGLSADYASNPALLQIPEPEETHAAVLLDSPATYVTDPYRLTILPSFRLSDAEGYSSLDSDYEHLTSKGEYDGDRTQLSGTFGVARDSTLYHDALTSGLSNGSAGVRRDTTSADLNWDRSLTELVDLDTDLNALRVRYAEGSGTALFTDYKYVSLAPTVGWKTSELTKWTFGVTGGLYNSLDGATESKSLNAQFGYSTKLSELWSVTATAGYSRAINKLSETQYEYIYTSSGLELVAVPVNAEASQNGTVFSFSLTRQGAVFGTTLTASRQLAPTGFAYLTREDTYSLLSSYQYGARWSFAATLLFAQYQAPNIGTTAPASAESAYYGLSATWQWTEKVSLTMSTSRNVQRLASPNPGVSSNTISLSISRRFNPILF